jgi:chromosome segregation ATPase
MNNVSREDYDRVVAGLTTQVNLEAEDADAKAKTLKSAAELIDQLMGDLRNARERADKAEESVQDFADKVVSLAMENTSLGRMVAHLEAQREELNQKLDKRAKRS